MANTAKLYNLIVEVRVFARLNSVALSAVDMDLPPLHEVRDERILIDAINKAAEELDNLGGSATTLRIKLLEWLDSERPSL